MMRSWKPLRKFKPALPWIRAWHRFCSCCRFLGSSTLLREKVNITKYPLSIMLTCVILVRCIPRILYRTNVGRDCTIIGEGRISIFPSLNFPSLLETIKQVRLPAELFHKLQNYRFLIICSYCCHFITYFIGYRLSMSPLSIRPMKMLWCCTLVNKINVFKKEDNIM